MFLIDGFMWLTSEDGLLSLIKDYGMWGVLAVALVIFVETGIVIMPFLPGDSLLFAVGAFLGVSGYDPILPIIIITLAAIIGDSLNYSIGRSRFAHKLIVRGLVKQSHIDKTHAYFEKHGGRTIIIARFVPIVRTLAPFVAGLSLMNRSQFFLYNCVGAVIWVAGLISAGVFFGQMEWVKANLVWVTLGIIFVSVLPIIIEVSHYYIKSKTKKI
jgi:membrane-associated protein